MWKNWTLKISEYYWGKWPEEMEGCVASVPGDSILLKCLIPLNWLRDSTQSLSVPVGIVDINKLIIKFIGKFKVSRESKMRWKNLWEDGSCVKVDNQINKGIKRPGVNHPYKDK